MDNNIINGESMFITNREEQIAGCEACGKLFPCLRYNDKNPIKLLFNSKNTGFLQTRLKNDRVKKRKIEFFGEENDQTAKIDQNKENINYDETNADLNFQEDMQILKTAVIPYELALIKKKLKRTFHFRRTLIKDENLDLLESFPYFFVCPELITYDFLLGFPKCKGNIVNSWPRYSAYIFNVIRNSGKAILYTEPERENDWNTETLTFLNILRLLPPMPDGQRKGSRLSDEQAVKRLIVFETPGKPDTDYLKDSAGKTPYIIGIGLNKLSITQYLVVLDSHLIALKTHSFLQAVDICSISVTLSI